MLFDALGLSNVNLINAHKVHQFVVVVVVVVVIFLFVCLFASDSFVVYSILY